MSIDSLVKSGANGLSVSVSGDLGGRSLTVSSARDQSEPVDTSKIDASKDDALLSDAIVSALGPEIASANRRLSTTSISMSLGVDRESGRIVVTLIDKKTKNTVLQIPSNTALNLDRRLEQLTGIILDTHG